VVLGANSDRSFYRQRETFKKSLNRNHNTVPRLHNLPTHDPRFEQHAHAILYPNESKGTEKSINEGMDISQYLSGDEPFDYGPHMDDMSYQCQQIPNQETTNIQNHQNVGFNPMHMSSQNSMQSKSINFIF
jgi:hypothetical protein